MQEHPMAAIREPVLKPVDIADLRPTQITVGMREVNAKRKSWREKRGKKSGKFLGKHMIPVILGPNDRHYVIDHHHLARALHEEGVKDVLVTVVANLSMVDRDFLDRSRQSQLDASIRRQRSPARLHGYSKIGE
jgi:hypothetical protein